MGQGESGTTTKLGVLHMKTNLTETVRGPTNNGSHTLTQF